MKILWLNTGLLLPLDKGGKLRTWHLMRHLARRHHITCVSFAEPEQERMYRGPMSDVCAELVTIPRRESTKEGVRFYGSVLRHLTSAVPYAVGQYRSPAYEKAVTSLLARGTFDRLVCDFLVPAINLPKRIPCPSIVFTHNVEAEIWRRHTETARSRLRRMLYARQWKRMLRFEGRTLARFDRVLTVSDVDRDTFRRLYPAGLPPAVSVIPTGVDTNYFTPTPEATSDPRHLVFTGSMDWLPNEDGMLYFCRKILPLIRKIEPDVTLSIVGRSPTPAVRHLIEDRGIEVTGRVADVRPHLARAAVYIVPLRIGGGTRLKIFEAMSAGRAVVSTSVGAEGLPTENGRHLLLADTPDAFARAVLTLLRDGGVRRRMEADARAFVTEHHDWSLSARVLEAALEETHVSPTHDRIQSSVPLNSMHRAKQL